MKVVILAGGFGTRISEGNSLNSKTYDKNRRYAHHMAYNEALLFLWP